LASNRIELLHQFESIFKTAVAHESEDSGAQYKEKKTEGQKSHETFPLSVWIGVGSGSKTEYNLFMLSIRSGQSRR
jgi:hypothetical protein